MPVLPDEARLLFLASRPDAACEETYLAALAATRPNWRALGALAEREKLLPVLWNYMRDHAELVPGDVRQAFRRQAAVTEFRMALTESALTQVVEQLDVNGIRVMLLKGTVLWSSTVYGSFAKRPMGDFDILVPPGDAQRAWDIMRKVGWTLELEGANSSTRVTTTCRRLWIPRVSTWCWRFTGPCCRPRARLHWMNLSCWREARPIRLGPTRVWVPSDRYQLLHLSIHFAWSTCSGVSGAR